MENDHEAREQKNSELLMTRNNTAPWASVHDTIGSLHPGMHAERTHLNLILHTPEGEVRFQLSELRHISDKGRNFRSIHFRWNPG
jgi:hypothetical protein